MAPLDGDGSLVGLMDVAQECLFEVGDCGEYATTVDIAFNFREPEVDLVGPRPMKESFNIYPPTECSVLGRHRRDSLQGRPS